MKHLRNIFALYGIVIALIAGCAIADQREGMALTKADQAFFSQLSYAVSRNNKEWIADHVSFPLTTKINGEKRTFKNREEFLTEYEIIIDSKVKRAVTLQQPNALFKNWRGLMVGNGEIWFTAVHADPKDTQRVEYYITGINN
ncbi:MAG: hypothetical protein ACYC7I_07180 [Gammaproteobacteria bacterium]